MKIERRETSPDAGCEAWEVLEDDKRHWITLRRSQYGPAWSAAVFVEPKSDQKPYWRTVRSWQKIAGEVRVYENTRADFRDAS